MLWFKKKKGEEQNSDESSEEENAEQKPAISGNLEVELTKIKSQLEALNEVRKANAEQFTRVSEQIGELRGALMDSNKAISVIEVASTRAIDMVNSVQPDKLMIEVRKTDAKVEALRANIEANETIMKDILRELKEMRSQMNFYKGADQMVKMNNEIKQELIDIKKSEGAIGKHADMVETIFIEADKKEFVKLLDKFTDFEKHTTNILKLLEQRSKGTLSSLNESFDELKKQLEKKYSTKLELKPIVEDTSKERSDDVTADKISGEPTDAEPKTSEQGKTEVSAEPKTANPESSDSKQKKGILGMFKR